MNIQDILQKLVSPFAEEHHIPLLAVGVSTNGKLTHVASAALPGYSFPSAPEHAVFRIASMTKSFAAAAVMKLAESQSLDLNAPITQYWHENTLVERWQQISVRQLLTMTAGLSGPDDPWADRLLDAESEVLSSELLNEAFFTCSPGEKFQYSNLGYMILGRLISNASGINALDYITERLLTPLQMAATEWNPASSEKIIGYKYMKDHFVPETDFVIRSDLALFGGLSSSITDITTWMHFLSSSYSSEPDGYEHILSKSSRREMQTLRVCREPSNSVQQVEFASGYGYGIGARFLNSEWHLAHSGGLPGFGSHMIWSLSGSFALVALANVTYAGAGTLCKNIIAGLNRDPSGQHSRLREGAQIVQSRGESLLDILLGESASPYTTALFSHNFIPDHDLEQLRKFSDALRTKRPSRDTFQIIPERSLAGTIQCGKKAVAYFSLSPVHGHTIQELKTLDLPE